MKRLILTMLFILTLCSVSHAATWQSVTASCRHTAAIKSDGTLWAWGDNYYGELGNGTRSSSRFPVQIGTDTNWQSVTPGTYHTVAIKSDGTLWAWGVNNIGQLGDGSTTNSLIPIKIGTDNNWQSVAAGSTHTVAIKSDGTMWAWGSNYFGQMGDGSTANSLIPIKIGTDANWQSVSAGVYHNVAIKRDGTLWEWGSKESHNSSDYNTVIPVKIGTAANWQFAVTSGSHVIAIQKDGTLWAWGFNNYGQIGDGTTTKKFSPIKIGNATDWKSASGGYYHEDGSFNAAHTVAIKSDGTMWAWGNNDYGQLGDGSTANSLIPIKIGTDANWQSVAAGVFNTAALKSDGTLWAWGLTEYSGLGGGNELSIIPTQYQPVSVTPSITNGTISPEIPQILNNGKTISFDIQPAPEYYLGITVSSMVGGTCPTGTLSGSTYTTGAITADCTLVISPLKKPIITPIIANGSIYPTVPQMVDYGSVRQFDVTPNTNYYVNSTTISGTCPAGTLSGGIYTTGAITSDCTVNIAAYIIPQSTITFPTGMPPYLQGGKISTITGTTTADPSLTISKVEVSLDNGASWQTATGTTSWSWSGALPANDAFLARCTDSNGKQSANATATITSSVLFYLKGSDTPMGTYATYTLAMLNWSGSPVSAVAVDISRAAAGTTAETVYKVVQQQATASVAALGKTLGGSYLDATTLRLNITGTNQTALPDADLAYLVASLGAYKTGTATYTPYPITMPMSPSASTPSGSLITSTGATFSQKALLLGDNNASKTVDIAEVQQAANVLLQVQPSNSSIDVNNDGIVTIADLQLAITANLGTLGSVSSTPPPSATINATLNLISSTTTVNAGDTIAVPIQLSNPSGEGIVATSNIIEFDPNVFTVTGVTTESTALNAGKQASYNIPSPGHLIVAVYGTNQTAIPDGKLATVTLTAIPTAPTGSASLKNTPSVADSTNNLRLMTGNSANFTINSNNFAVTATVNGTGGTITCNPTSVQRNSSSICDVTSDHNYTILSVTGCGGSLIGNTYTTGLITGNCTVSATFAASVGASFTVTPSTGDYGTLSPSTPQSVSSNSTTSFTVNSQSGYELFSITGCGGTLSGSSYTTGPVNGNCTVTATFTPIASSSHNGIVAVDTGRTVPNISDALIVFNYCNDKVTLTPAQLVHADVAPLGSSGAPQGNGTVDIADVIMILRRSIGAENW